MLSQHATPVRTHALVHISPYASLHLLYNQHPQHVITIRWKNQLNQHVEQLSHHTRAEPVVPVQETEGAPLCRDKPYFWSNATEP